MIPKRIIPTVPKEERATLNEGIPEIDLTMESRIVTPKDITHKTIKVKDTTKGVINTLIAFVHWLFYFSHLYKFNEYLNLEVNVPREVYNDVNFYHDVDAKKEFVSMMLDDKRNNPSSSLAFPLKRQKEAVSITRHVVTLTSGGFDTTTVYSDGTTQHELTPIEGSKVGHALLSLSGSPGFEVTSISFIPSGSTDEKIKLLNANMPSIAWKPYETNASRLNLQLIELRLDMQGRIYQPEQVIAKFNEQIQKHSVVLGTLGHPTNSLSIIPLSDVVIACRKLHWLPNQSRMLAEVEILKTQHFSFVSTGLLDNKLRLGLQATGHVDENNNVDLEQIIAINVVENNTENE